MLKEEIAMDFLQWFAKNKDSLLGAIKTISNFVMKIATGIAKIIEFFFGKNTSYDSTIQTGVGVMSDSLNYNPSGKNINVTINQKLSKRELEYKLKTNEYERLDESTKNKLIKQDKIIVSDFIKNPILIKNSYNYIEISEKILKQLILEDMDNFLTELGDVFCYIKNEYKIKLGDRYNYIDLLLYNIKYKCYVVVELKVTELKSEHIGQIEKYMNYIDKNIKTIEEDKTIGIIICKQENKYVIKYCSDDRIIAREYQII